MEYFYRDFMCRDLESKVNEKSLYYDYTFPYDEMLKYAKDILKIPLEEIIQDIMTSNDEIVILAKDVVQFSDLDDATTRLCSLLKSIDNPGVTYIEAGKLLLNDGKYRKDGAYTKYGENHLKTAEVLGLTFELTHTYFLSSLGSIFHLLSEDEIDRLIVRLVLRGKLVRRLIRATNNGKVNVRDMLHMLSDSTYVRRRSNIKALFRTLEMSSEFDFSFIYKHFIW